MNLKTKLIISCLLSSFFSFLLSIFIVGCETSEFSDGKVSDRVKACAAGFSIGTQASLEGSLIKFNLSGQLNGDVKEDLKLAIFDEIKDEKLRIQVYEDYIKCVETNWNSSK